MAFDKGHEKLGGRKKGTRNKGTDSIKTLLNTLLPEEELAKLWKKKLYSRDPQIAMKAFELMLHYRFGRPVQLVVGEDSAPPMKIDISAIPKHHVKSMSTLENKQQKPQLVTLEQLTQKLVEAVKKASPAQRAEMRRNLYAQLGVKP